MFPTGSGYQRIGVITRCAIFSLELNRSFSLGLMFCDFVVFFLSSGSCLMQRGIFSRNPIFLLYLSCVLICRYGAQYSGAILSFANNTRTSSQQYFPYSPSLHILLLFLSFCTFLQRDLLITLSSVLSLTFLKASSLSHRGAWPFERKPAFYTMSNLVFFVL